MAGFIGGRTSAFDYIGPDLPSNPQNGEMWFDTDGASDGSGEVKVYDGANSAWEATGFTSHADLTDVTRSAHHPPVDVSGPLTQPSDQSLGLSIGDGLANSNGSLVAALGNGLGVDANGQVYVPANAVSQSMLGFDTATQAELDGHAGDATNPHNVTDDQTGAASALSNHAADGNAHHSRPTATGTHNPPTQDVEVYSNSIATNTTLSGEQVSPERLATAAYVDPGISANWYLRLYDVSGNEIAYFSDNQGTGNTWVSFPAALADSFEVRNSDDNDTATFTLSLRRPIATSHSHSI